MKLTPRQRWAVLGLMLIGTIMAVVSAEQLPRKPSSERKAETDETGPAKKEKVAAAIPLEKLKRLQAKSDFVDVFAGKSWHVPPPPPKRLPPPPPSAPPLPFSYLGRLQEDTDRMVIFLVKGDVVYTVRQGDVIENTYRIEGVASGNLTITYLPLDIRQTLHVGSDS